METRVIVEKKSILNGDSYVNELIIKMKSHVWHTKGGITVWG